MQKHHVSQSGLFNPRALAAFALCAGGVLLAMLSFASTAPNAITGLDANAPVSSRFVDEHFAGPGVNAMPAAAKIPFGPAAASMPLAPSGSSDWSIVPSPNSISGQPTNFLSGVTCISATDCWAVGHAYIRGTPQTLIEHWDGTSWSIVTSPSTSATKTNILSEVTCASASDCWAVGFHQTDSALQTLIEHWDGTSWSIVSSPNTTAVNTNILSDVTCASASDCWAVGYRSQAGALQTLVEHWDGTSWSIVSSPNTSATMNNYLAGVTCVSASDCWAVGSSDVVGSPTTGPIYQTLIQRWNGTSWSIVSAPPTVSVQQFLTGVTCTSASDCWAVGSADNGTLRQTLVARWNGTSWSVVSSPNTSPSQNNVLSRVTCVAANDCWAAGYARAGSVDQTLVEHWDGTSWSIVASPNTSATQFNVFYDVMCASTADCWAVGYADSGGSQTLVQRWNGNAWSIVTSANVQAVQTANFLHNVTCLSASDCWAVGYYYNGSAQSPGFFQTLIQRWNGASWSIVPSPSTSVGQDNLLTGVACTSPSNCWAVGYSDNGSIRKTLIERWNGTSWSIVPSPNTSATDDNFLAGVTCLSASDCWAVGSSGESDTGGAVYQTLIERWNGTSWSIIPSANSSPVQGNVLYSVWCTSASDCWAVGYFFTGSVRQTLIERWNGASWATVSSPNTSATNLLTSVTCVAASDCWAVGHSNAAGVNQTLIERWDGASWAIASSPNTSPSESNYLFGVTCVSPSDCWAVGYSFSGGATHTLIDRWDGSSWSIVTSPNHSTTYNNLFLGVTCATASDCWAVGYYHTGILYQTLAAHYAGPSAPIPSNVVSRKTHGTAGNFNIDLPLTGDPGIECRQGQGTNSDEHQVVLTFSAPATVDSAACDGKPATTSTSGNDVIVNCTAIPNGKVITIALTSVTVGASSGNVSVPMGVLLGDVTTNKIVSNTDVAEVKAQVTAPVSESNFRHDVNANGIISNTDVSDTKAQVSTSLP